MLLLKILPLFLIVFNVSAKNPMSSSRLSKLAGEKNKNSDAKFKWDQRYNKRSYVYGKAPAKFLAENYDYFEKESSILDMGMGEGRNAVFLAQKGHKVLGVDISSVAIKKARKLAKEYGVRIQGIVASLDTYKIAPNSLDALICFYYVDRELNNKMIKWLKPGGILMYEANTVKELEKSKKFGKESINHYLKEQELLKMFPKMKILKYEEPLHENKFRASIILQKSL